MMARCIIWTIIFSVIAAILQSTVLGMLPFMRIRPDLALCVIVFSAYVNGTMTGQVSGFFSGILQDFISASPLGFHTLIRTIIGAVAGIFKGALFLDYIFLPIILCALATILKAFIVFIINLILTTTPVHSFASSDFWIELALNALCAPLLFLLLRKFKPILIGRS
jgi:rod shape-determining protein MreD